MVQVREKNFNSETNGYMIARKGMAPSPLRLLTLSRAIFIFIFLLPLDSYFFIILKRAFGVTSQMPTKRSSTNPILRRSTYKHRGDAFLEGGVIVRGTPLTPYLFTSLDSRLTGTIPFRRYPFIPIPVPTSTSVPIDLRLRVPRLPRPFSILRYPSIPPDSPEPFGTSRNLPEPLRTLPVVCSLIYSLIPFHSMSFHFLL